VLPGRHGLPYAVAFPSGNAGDSIADTMQQPVTPADPRVATMPDAEDAAEFPRIPGYRFQKRLGQGGMATVYLATQQSLDRPVSIKVMEREALQDETSMQRFENEARTIAKLSHPSIVNIYEVGRTADERMYYIMPYLANGDLAQRDLRHNEARIVEVLRTLLSALEYAHARGIVHRDVKEENVLFDDADRPLLTDFGIALSKRDTSRITTAGLAVGSSGYMAPEQARGDVVDGRADLYSVGVMAYELLTGKLPYRSPDPLTLALMHVQNPIPRLPPEKRHWQSFIDRAMAKSPSQRFRDAQQMLHALDRVDRRTGNHISGRILRRYDDTVQGRIWKRPGTIALGGVLLVAFGLYSARDQLPKFGAAKGALQAPTIAAPVASANAPSSAAAKPPAAASAKPVATAAKGASSASTAQAASPLPSIMLPTTTAIDTTNASGANAASPPKPSLVPASIAPVAIAPASTAPASISPDAAVLGEARDALAHANLTTPADDNAIDLTRMAWKLSPAKPDTQALASDVLKAISVQQALAIVQHKDQRVLDFQQKAQQLADATIGRTVPAWRALHTSASAAIGKRVQVESDAADAAALKRTEALAKQLDLSDVYTKALATAQKQAGAAATLSTAAAASAAANIGPGFVLLPVSPKSKELAAMARVEVTRHEYAQFVNATRRPASACGDPKAATRKNWTVPGFVQTSEQPVVCVSWNDAAAYVQWLSAQKGQHYRLAASTDWHPPATKGETPAAPGALAGDYSEWLQNCGSGCQNHLVARRGWREHGSDLPPGRPADQGYDDVGFRVVRVLDAHH
jgi:serine/threonine protein kinase